MMMYLILGTLLYASQLFQQSVPPVMAFHLGSLGFLTPFRFDNFQEQVNNVLEGKWRRVKLVVALNNGLFSL